MESLSNLFVHLVAGFMVFLVFLVGLVGMANVLSGEKQKYHGFSRPDQQPNEQEFSIGAATEHPVTSKQTPSEALLRRMPTNMMLSDAPFPMDSVEGVSEGLEDKTLKACKDAFVFDCALRGEDPAGLIVQVGPESETAKRFNEGMKFRRYVKAQSQHDREALLTRFRDSQE